MENKFFYAIYKGDRFIDLCDTIYQVAKKLNCSVSTARHLTYPSVKKGTKVILQWYTSTLEIRRDGNAKRYKETNQRKART